MALILLGLGTAITVGMVLFNLKREAILQRVRIAIVPSSEQGFRVAVCDQVEDARLAKGLVRREVTRRGRNLRSQEE